MDLSNYEEIIKLVRAVCRGMSPEDQEDFVQDVCLKLLVSDGDKPSKAIMRNAIRQTKIDWQRKQARRPSLVYNNKLVEESSQEEE